MHNVHPTKQTNLKHYDAAYDYLNTRYYFPHLQVLISGV